MGSHKQPAISIERLSKRYGSSTVYALKDLSINIYPGEVYGLLGSNGAGKSTTIRLLMDFIRPTSGKATIKGLDSSRESTEIKQLVGYLPGDAAVYEKMTGEQFLAYVSELQGVDTAQWRKELAHRLESDLSKKIGELSRGNRQKIGLIQALMHKPEVLILDEPTSGLDPLMQEVFYQLMREAKGQGTAVLISSHILGEVQKVCDRVGIIRKGELVAEKNIADLALEASQTFEVVFKGKPPLSELKKLERTDIRQLTDNSIEIHSHGDIASLLGVLAKYPILRLDSRALDLEEVFLKFYGEEDYRP